jgi:hypothetical protein
MKLVCQVRSPQPSARRSRVRRLPTDLGFVSVIPDVRAWHVIIVGPGVQPEQATGIGGAASESPLSRRSVESVGQRFVDDSARRSTQRAVGAASKIRQKPCARIRIGGHETSTDDRTRELSERIDLRPRPRSRAGAITACSRRSRADRSPRVRKLSPPDQGPRSGAHH